MPSQSITVRPYQDDDWQRICEIHDLARPMELQGSCDASAFIPIEQDPEAEELRLCEKLIAVQEEAIVGFAGFDYDYLAWLYVDPGFHQRGIGGLLLNKCLEQMTGRQVWTIALTGNTVAIKLYQSRGFAIVEEIAGNNAGYPCVSYRLSQ